MEYTIADKLQDEAGHVAATGLTSGEGYEVLANAAVMRVTGLQDIESEEFCDLRSDFDYYVEQCVDSDIG